MPNKRFNKQVPAFKAGGRAGKMGGGMMMQKPMMKKGGNVKKIEKAFKPKKNLKKVDSKKNPGLAITSLYHRFSYNPFCF